MPWSILNEICHRSQQVTRSKMRLGVVFVDVVLVVVLALIQPYWSAGCKTLSYSLVVVFPG